MRKNTRAAEDLVAAVSNGRLSDASQLLTAGVDIDALVDGRTPLHYVVASRSSMKGFRWLLDQGASLDLRDSNDLTPLMTACGREGVTATEMALALIEAGCDVKARRKRDGMSAMEFAAKSASPSVLRALAKKGTSVNGPRNGDLFPALLAARAGNLENIKELVALGCDLSKKTRLPWAKGMTCLGVARIEKRSRIVAYLESIGAP
jgi:ankyrin repeat protein